MVEAAILQKLGFRIKRKLKTLQAFIPEPQFDDLEWKRKIAGEGPLTQLDEMPPIAALASNQHLIKSVNNQFTDELNATLKVARQALQHQFDLLGSGLKHLGDEIDWSLDFKSGKRWPLKDYRLQKIVDLQTNADVKVPWELSRCNHFLSIAVGYQMTFDSHLALEFENQILSWRNQNPYQQSVNWTCPMETAIRCVNWLIAYQILAAGFEFAQNFKDILTIELFKGGNFIRHNLERTATGFNTNHFLSDLLGLLFLGQLFRETEEGRGWLEFARHELEKEIVAQVSIDGLDYESSLPYHGLVTEIFLLCRLLAKRCGFEFSDTFNDRLQLMVENLARFTDTDGKLVCFGDADDGRILKFSNRHPRDFRDLIALGLSLVGGITIDQKYESLEATLLYEIQPKDVKFKPFNSVCLAESGVCQLRSKLLTVGFYVNEVGTGGLGNHKHNDLLSLTLSYNGKPLLIDPGSYVYTQDEKWRNHFRSTEAHSTVLVDWEEQNRMVNGLLFFLRSDASPGITLWESNERSDIVTAEHNGYERLSGGVIHRRSLHLDKHHEVLLIRDDLLGSGTHEIHSLFQFADLRIEALNPSQIVFHSDCQGSGVLFTDLSTNPHLLVDTNWISPSYGIKEPGIRLCSGGKFQLPVTRYFAIIPLQNRDIASVTKLARENIRKLQW